MPNLLLLLLNLIVSKLALHFPHWPCCNGWPCGFAPDSWSNWVLAALGVIGARFAYRTVQATIRAANAAHRSAEAQMNGERAWLLIAPPSWTKNTIDTLGLPPVIEIAIENSGKTAARVQTISANYEVVRKSTELLESPQYLSVKAYHDLLLVPKDSIPHVVSRDDGEGIDHSRNQHEMLRDDVFIYIYARVEYKDI